MLGRHEGSPATVCLALGVHLALRALAAGWQPRVRRLVGFGRDHPPRVRPGAQLDRASVAGNDSLARNRSCDPPGPALELERNTAYMGEAAAPITAFPFVGRDDEMGVLEAALLAAENRLGALVLIAGEPGSGKSRLVDEFALRAANREVTILRGRAWEAGGAPAYWPWRQALRAYVRERDPEELRSHLGQGASEVAHIVPDLYDVFRDLPTLAPSDSDGARFRLFDATAVFLQRASMGRPLVLVLDDIHVADVPSLLLARFVSRQLRGTRLMLVLTYRDEEIERSTGLLDALADLVGVGDVRRVDLRGLGRTDVAHIVEVVTGAMPPEAVVSRVHSDTDGNALFVSEVVRLLADDGRLAPGISMSDHLTIPPTVRSVISRRLERLSPECRRTLELAAVIGREFGLELLSRLAGSALDDVHKLLDEAIAARVVTSQTDSPDTLRFSHELVRNVLYDTSARSRRITLHRTIAEMLEAQGADDIGTVLAQIAHHYLAAAPSGDVERAIVYADRAGWHALMHYGYEDAIRLFEQAINLSDSSGGRQDTRRCELHLALGDSLARSGDLAQARSTFMEAAQIARTAALSTHLARAALGYGGRWVWGRAADDLNLIPMLRGALEALGPEDSPERVRLLGRLACATRSDPDRSIGARSAADAVAMAERLGDDETIAYALDAQLGATFWYDNPGERLARSGVRSGPIVHSSDDERLLNVLLSRVSALIELGHLGEADRQLDLMDLRAQAIRQPVYQWMVVSIRAMLALLRGDLDGAAALMEQELKVGSPAITSEASSTHHAHDLWLRKETGRTAGLEARARRAADELWYLPTFRCFLVELIADLGDESRAREMFDLLAANDFEALLPRDNEWLLSASLLADVCAMLGDADRAEYLYRELLPVGHLNVVGLSELSRGSVARCLGVLAATMHRFDDADRHFRQALAHNVEMGAHPWVARTRYDHARMLLRRDAPGDREIAEKLIALALEDVRGTGLSALARRIEGLNGARSQDLVPPVSVFRRDGEYWTIAFDGDSFRLRDSKGLAHLSRLLERPSREVHVLELAGPRSAAAQPLVGTNDMRLWSAEGSMPALDGRAKDEYQRRIAELTEEIDESTAWNDIARTERAREELDFIARELSAAVGLGGRDRHSTSSSERARVNVTRAIKSAMARIAPHSKALAAHLDSTIRTGTYCSYMPDPRAPNDWQT